MSNSIDKPQDRLALQRQEFEAADLLSKMLKILGATAVVNDDYPRVRHQYEGALASLIQAMKANGRFDAGNRYGLVSSWLFDKLQAFKKYTHERLDAMDVPVAPESPHLAAGCRIGARLDYVEVRLSTIIETQREAEWRAYVDAFVGAGALRELRRNFEASKNEH